MTAKLYVGTLQAALDRAARIAPTKGIAFDKAAGVVLEIGKEDGAFIRATNLEVFYRERINDVAEYPDKPVAWRMPSGLFNGVIAGFPTGKEVTIKQVDERTVHLRCGRKQAKLKLMPVDLFPTWARIEADGLQPAPEFGTKVAQVAWAVDQQVVPFCGINIDGKNLNATDKYKVGTVPCEVPLDKPITASMALLANIIKTLPDDVSMRADDRAVYMRIGQEVEIVSTLYAQAYPNLHSFLPTEFAFDVKVNREELSDAITAMLVLVKSERYPLLMMDFEEGSIALSMTVPETGDMSDVIEAEFPEGMFSAMRFTPAFLVAALEAAKGKYVTLSVPADTNKIMRISDTQSEYVGYVMPRSDVTPPVPDSDKE